MAKQKRYLQILHKEKNMFNIFKRKNKKKEIDTDHHEYWTIKIDSDLLISSADCAEPDTDTDMSVSFIPEDTIVINGFEDCIIGVVSGASLNRDVLCYDEAKMIQKLCDRDGMTYIEAAAFFEYNILNAYMGENSPVFMTKADKLCTI